MSSFDITDEILRKLAKKSVFPNMKAIVVAGHSAGGQFVNRYEMSNVVHDTLGVPVSYVVANPSSYAWPDSTRALPQDDALPANAVGGWNVETVHTKFAFGPFDATQGRELRSLADRPGESDRRLHGEAVRRTAEEAARVAADDVPARPGGHAAARRVRLVPARRWRKGPRDAPAARPSPSSSTRSLGAKHQIMIVPECGHNDRCMYTTDMVFPAVFPKS